MQNQEIKRTRGRPRKNIIYFMGQPIGIENVEVVEKKSRGRPRKEKVIKEKKPRGRPRKVQELENVEVVEQKPKRGRPQKEKKEKVVKEKKPRGRKVQMVKASIVYDITFDMLDTKTVRTYPQQFSGQVRTIEIPKTLFEMRDMEKIKEYLLNNKTFVEDASDPTMIQGIEELKDYNIDIYPETINERINEIVLKSVEILPDDDSKDVVNKKMDLKMFAAKAMNIDLPEITRYKFSENQCVYGALFHRYGFEKEYCLSVFREIQENLQLEDGVDSNMLLHLAKVKDFSLYGMDWNKSLFVKNVSKNRNLPPFVYIYKNSHCYLIDDKEEIQKISHRFADRDEVNHKISQIQSVNKISEYYKNKWVDSVPIDELENVEKGSNVMYFTKNLFEIMKYLMEKYNLQISSRNVRLIGTRVVYLYFSIFDLHIYADINFEPINEYNRQWNDEEKEIIRIANDRILKIQNFDYTCNCLIYSRDNVSACYEDVRNICLNLNIVFRNQSIQSIVIEHEKNFFNFGKKEKLHVDDEEKLALFAMYGHTCSECGEKFDEGKLTVIEGCITKEEEKDDSELENLRVVCKDCKKGLEMKDDKKFEFSFNPSESSFNDEVDKIFKSEECMSYAFVEKGEDYDEIADLLRKREINPDDIDSIDFNKCRRNILLHNTHKMPVFSVLDKAEQFSNDDEILPGIYYVLTENCFPMRGNGWYTHHLVEYCMNLNIITKEEIKFKVLSSFSLKPDYFSNFTKSIVDNLGSYSKFGPNSFIGCFNKKDNETTSIAFTQNIQEALVEYWERNGDHIESFNVGDSKIYSIFSKHITKFHDTRSPLYKFIIESEAMLLHELYLKMKSRGCKILSFATDNICFYRPGGCWDIFDIVTKSIFPDGNEMYKFEPKKIYPNRQPTERMPRLKREKIYEHSTYVWNVQNDGDSNDFTDLVSYAVESNGCAINAGPGCGKSYLLRLIIDKIRELKQDLLILCPTNMAANVVGGQTLFSFFSCVLSSKKSFNNALKNIEWIVVDEISMVTEFYYKMFFVIHRMFPNIKFIFCGDFGQLLPVGDRVANADYANSLAFFQLCSGNKIHLTKNRRSNDEMSKLYRDIDNIDISTFKKEKHMINICYTNKKRIEINVECMNKFIQTAKDEAKRKKKKAPEPLVLKKLKWDSTGHDVELLPGMPIISKTTNNSFSNNEFSEIVAIDDHFKTIEVKRIYENVHIDYNKFQQMFNLRFCITIHKSQGQTFNGPYTIHQWDHKHFDNRLKYVALSRTTNKDFVNII